MTNTKNKNVFPHRTEKWAIHKETSNIEIFQVFLFLARFLIVCNLYSKAFVYVRELFVNINENSTFKFIEHIEILLLFPWKYIHKMVTNIMVTCCIVCFTFSRCLCIEILGNVEFIWFTDFWCKAKLHLNWIIFSFLTATQLEYTWIFNVKHVLYRIIWCWMIFSFLHTVKYCDIHSSNVNDESSNWLWHLIFTIIIIKWKKKTKLGIMWKFSIYSSGSSASTCMFSTWSPI